MPLTIELLPDPAARDVRLTQLASARHSSADRLNLLHGSALQRRAASQLLAEADGGAVAAVYGYTPVDLAESASRYGNAAPRRPWPPGADLTAVEQLLQSSTLTEWPPDAPGLAAAMLSTLTDLREASLTPADVSAGGLRRIYDGWIDIVRNAADRTSRYEDAVSAATPDRAYTEALGGAPLIVSGIYDLTRIQRLLIARCARITDVRMLLVMAGAAADAPPQRTLAALQRECGALVERSSVAPAAAPSQQYFSASDPSSEADEIASRILQLGHQGTAFDRMLVLHQHGSPGDDRIAASLERAGVPSWRIGGQSLAQTPLGQAALGLAAVLLQPETAQRGALLDLLSHRAVQCSGRAADWEQQALAAGLDRGLHEMAALASADHESELSRLLSDLAERSTALADCESWAVGVDTLLEALRHYLGSASGDDPMLEAVQYTVTPLRQLDQHGNAWQPSAANTSISRAIGSQVIRDGQPLIDGVNIGAAGGPARGVRYEAVFIAGAAERVFPALARQDPLLPDAARSRINQRIPDALALQRDRALSDRHAWNLARLSAERSFTASWSRRTSAVGGPTRASSLLLESAVEIERLDNAVASFAPTNVDGEIDWLRPLRAPDAASFNLAVLAAPAIDRAALLREIWPQMDAAVRARRRRNAPQFTEFDGVLSGALDEIADWRPLERTWTSQALETLVTCPYRFFLQQMMNIQTTNPAEPQDQQEAVLGDAVRAVLTAWVQSYLDDPESRDWITYSSDPDRLSDLADTLTGSERARRAVERLRVREASDARDGWRPQELDLSVDRARARVSGGRSLRLSARIDRLDVHADGRQRAVLWFHGADLPSVHGFVDGSSFASLGAMALLSDRGVPVRQIIVEHRSITERGHFAAETLQGGSLAAPGAPGTTSPSSRLSATLALLADQLEAANFVPNPGQPAYERPNCRRCPVEAACTADLADRYRFKSRSDPEAVRAMETLRRQRP